MINFLLSIIGEDRLWKFLLEKTSFYDQETDEVIWVDVFRRMPAIRAWFKHREIQLLKSSLTGQNTNMVIRGQLLENKFYQRFDVPSGESVTIKVETEKEKPISRDGFLRDWGESK